MNIILSNNEAATIIGIDAIRLHYAQQCNIISTLTEEMVQQIQSSHDLRERILSCGDKTDIQPIIVSCGGKKSWVTDAVIADAFTPIGKYYTKIGRLKIAEYIFNLQNIDIEKIKKFVVTKNQSVAANRASGAIKRREKQISLFPEREKLAQVTQTLKATHPFYEIAFYLWHLDSYIKDYITDRQREQLYAIKGEVIIKGYNKYPDIFNVFFIEKGNKTTYCSWCREDAISRMDKNRSRRSDNWIDYANEPCADCNVYVNYYSLYEFFINKDNVCCSFRIPYEKELLKQFGRIPKPNTEGNGENGFRYNGETLSFDNKLLTLNMVKTKLKSFINGEI